MARIVTWILSWARLLTMKSLWKHFFGNSPAGSLVYDARVPPCTKHDRDECSARKNLRKGRKRDETPKKWAPPPNESASGILVYARRAKMFSRNKEVKLPSSLKCQNFKCCFDVEDSKAAERLGFAVCLSKDASRRGLATREREYKMKQCERRGSEKSEKEAKRSEQKKVRDARMWKWRRRGRE